MPEVIHIACNMDRRDLPGMYRHTYQANHSFHVTTFACALQVDILPSEIFCESFIIFVCVSP